MDHMIKRLLEDYFDNNNFNNIKKEEELKIFLENPIKYIFNNKIFELLYFIEDKRQFKLIIESFKENDLKFYINNYSKFQMDSLFLFLIQNNYDFNYSLVEKQLIQKNCSFVLKEYFKIFEEDEEDDFESLFNLPEIDKKLDSIEELKATKKNK